LLRDLGARDVVVQTDLDWQRSRTVRPAVLQLLVRDPSLGALHAFGTRGQNVTGPSVPPGPNLGLEHGLRPVQVLAVPDPIPVVRAAAGAPIVLSGDAFGIDEMARAGLLDGSPPILYSGGLTAPQLA